jgi:hypothetical protein
LIIDAIDIIIDISILTLLLILILTLIILPAEPDTFCHIIDIDYYITDYISLATLLAIDTLLPLILFHYYFIIDDIDIDIIDYIILIIIDYHY